jgi:hypothetical protein
MKTAVFDRVPTVISPTEDNRGVFYYLGTKGYSQKYKNPSLAHEVRCFTSTLYSGRPSMILDTITEQQNPCMTQNLPMQFVGAILQNNRRLVPTAYAFKNTDLWQMCSWQLQASNDLKTWVILDKREFEEEQAGLCCWGIREDVKEVYPDGFNSFRIQ